MSSGSETEPELSKDLIFDLLSSPRRRMALYFLRERNGSATVTELAREIASLEYDIPKEELSRQQQKRVYVSLYQTHVPKLDDAGIVEYDDESSEVRLTSRARKIDTFLGAEEGRSYPWPYHYLALAIASGILFATATVADISFLTPLIAGLTVTVAFALSGITQLVTRRYHEGGPSADLSDEWLR